MLRGSSLLVAVILFCAACASSYAAVVAPPRNYKGTPIEFGVSDLNKALAGIKADVRIRVLVVGSTVSAAAAKAMDALPAKAESFAIARVGRELAIVGRDKTGAMYGCLELAERLDMNGARALDIKKPISQSPAVEFRAVNPFLTLPYSPSNKPEKPASGPKTPPTTIGTPAATSAPETTTTPETESTENPPEESGAETPPTATMPPPTTKENAKTWYFLQMDYWRGYLDQLARARINWLDLHGMYDINTTIFPNIYPYFITSEKFPDVGVGPAVAKRNLAMLKKIMRMAKERGIKFAIMSYSAGWNGAGLRKPTSKGTSENLAEYTREVVRKMIEQCPDLEMIGFRIGESGQKEDFYLKSYIPAIEEAGRSVGLYTRTWGAKKDQILMLGRQFPGRFFIEIKYNGEQFGPPYIVAGGRMKNWWSYSYQEYYSYPRDYHIMYQLRANGTHRVFPWGNPIWAARANLSSLLAGSIGHCFEPIDAYYPKYDFRHRSDSPNRWYNWQYQRDWYFYQVWGRTAYDPSLAKQPGVWLRMLAKRFGKTAAPELYDAMNWASMIVPDAYTSFALGPDHRQHAVELEWGGDVKAWAKGQPFDMQNVQPISEYVTSLMRGEPSARATPARMALYLADEARNTRRYVELARAKMAKPTPEFNDLTTELVALSYVGDYYSHKLIAATLYAVMMASSDVSMGELVRAELKAAADAWQELAKIGDKHYRPFVDRLRMHTEFYTWAKEGERLSGDMKALDDAIAEIKASGKSGKAPEVKVAIGGSGPVVLRCDSSLSSSTERSAPRKLTVRVKLAAPDSADKVFLKTKPFPSDKGNWTVAPMTRSGAFYIGEIEVQPEGLMWCIEAFDAQGNGTMWPDFRKETPYRYVAPWNSL